MKVDLYDLVEMKKPHPCINRTRVFQIVRIGADIKIQCQGCGNVIMLPRHEFNKKVKAFISHQDHQILNKE